MPATIEQIYELSYSCAQSIWEQREPTEAYARALARLLTGTAAHESGGLKHNRQIGFSDDTPRGAWSFWQIEPCSVTASVDAMHRRPGIEAAAIQWYSDHRTVTTSLPDFPWQPVAGIEFLRLLKRDVPLACLFARLHYLRVPAPVPPTVREQAAYWKQRYNTLKGKGTITGYLISWVTWCEEPLVRIGDLEAKYSEDCET